MAKTHSRRITVSDVLFVAAGIASLLCLVWVNLTLYPNLGNIAGTLLFGGIAAVCFFRKRLIAVAGRLWKRRGGKILLCVFAAVLTAGAVMCAVFSVNMLRYSERDSENPEVVIVLGCALHGEIPSYMLSDRLSVALSVLERNPEAVCVVSGGKGVRETITEAEAMRRYLVRRGISAERIILEDRSTSTEENLRYSAEILRNAGISGKTVVVTSDFHQYRADIYARRAGLSVGHISAKTELRVILNYVIREGLALFRAVLLP